MAKDLDAFRARILLRHVAERRHSRERVAVEDARFAKLVGETIVIVCATDDEAKQLRKKYPDLATQIKGPSKGVRGANY